MAIVTGAQFGAALQIYSQKYTQKSSINTNNLQKLLVSAKLRDGSFDLRFPVMYSFHGLDILPIISAAKAEGSLTDEEANIVLTGMQKAIVTLSNKYPELTMEKWRKIESDINTFTNSILIGSQISDSDLPKAEVEVKKAFNELASNFKSGAYLVGYTERRPPAGTFRGRLPSIKLLHNSFSNFRSSINNAIKREITTILKTNNITDSRLNDANYITTKILNWGHTRTGDRILSAKLMSSLININNVQVASGTGDLATNLISKDFIQETGQVNTEIKIHRGKLQKGNNEVLSLVISSEFVQKVIAQSSKYNQNILGPKEIAWSLSGAISRNPKILKALGVNSLSELTEVLLKLKTSPNSVDRIKDTIASALTGNLAKLNNVSDKTIAKFSTKEKIKVKKVVLKAPKGGKAPTTMVNSLILNKPVSLIDLQLLINTHLQDVISANMGAGGSKGLLNYRTGRFASSVKLERLTVSREGMISAFYSYMKNPYQTFEPGFAQGIPGTRSPKTLISRSIREIAATKVHNRMRTVLL